MESAYTKFRGYASGTPNFLTFCPSPFDFLFILYLLLACNFPFNCLSSSQVRKSTVSLFGLGWSHFRNWIWWTSNVTVTVKIQRFFDYTATPPHTGLSKLVFNTNWQKTWELISQNLIGIDTHVHKGITVSQFEPLAKKFSQFFCTQVTWLDVIKFPILTTPQWISTYLCWSSFDCVQTCSRFGKMFGGHQTLLDTMQYRVDR